MTTKQDIDFTVKCEDANIFVSDHMEGLWLGVHIRRGSASTPLTLDEAERLLQALQEAINMKRSND